METQVMEQEQKQPVVKKKKVSKHPLIFRRTTKGEKTVFGIMFGFFVFYAVVLLFPMALILMNSFKGALEYNDDLIAGKIYAFPDKWLFSNYSNAFSYIKVPIGNREVGIPEMIFNTIWMAGGGPFVQVTTVMVTGYVFARYNFRLRSFFLKLNIALMMIPVFGTGPAGMRWTIQLGLYDNPLNIFLTALAPFGGTFLMFLAFFKGVAKDYADAAMIDGAGQFTVFFKIMIPQAIGMWLVFFILSFMSSYQQYESHLLFMPSYCTLATGMYYCQTILPRRGDQPMYFAALFLSAIPLLILFSIFSDKILTNVTLEGLKG